VLLMPEEVKAPILFFLPLHRPAAVVDQGLMALEARAVLAAAVVDTQMRRDQQRVMQEIPHLLLRLKEITVVMA